MALTPEQIDAIDVRTLGHQHFARAIEAEVRKQDAALIWQLLEAVESSSPYTDSTHAWKREGLTNKRAAAIAAALARLEQPCVAG